MDKREAILKAAVELFAERGYYGTSVSLIVERAQVGTGTIYRYFKDKEEMVNILYRHWKTEMVKANLEDLPVDLPLRAQFHEIWQRWTTFARTHPDGFTFIESHHHVPYLDQTSRNIGERLSIQYLGIFEKGRQDQVIKDLPPSMLMIVVGGIFKEMMKEHRSGHLELSPEVIDRVEEMCWEAIRR
jgi:TetR/AcrR family transcriptional regulator, repressor of fatR-cypB operon